VSLGGDAGAKLLTKFGLIEQAIDYASQRPDSSYLSRALSLSLFLTHSVTLTLSLPHTHTQTHTHSLTFTLSHTHSLSLTVPLSLQVAYAWAVSLGGDAGAKLLTKFGLIEQAIDYATESGAFDQAFHVHPHTLNSQLQGVGCRGFLPMPQSGRQIVLTPQVVPSHDIWDPRVQPKLCTRIINPRFPHFEGTRFIESSKPLTTPPRAAPSIKPSMYRP